MPELWSKPNTDTGLSLPLSTGCPSFVLVQCSCVCPVLYLYLYLHPLHRSASACGPVSWLLLAFGCTAKTACFAVRCFDSHSSPPDRIAPLELRSLENALWPVLRGRRSLQQQVHCHRQTATVPAVARGLAWYDGGSWYSKPPCSNSEAVCCSENQPFGLTCHGDRAPRLTDCWCAPPRLLSASTNMAATHVENAQEVYIQQYFLLQRPFGDVWDTVDPEEALVWLAHACVLSTGLTSRGMTTSQKLVSQMMSSHRSSGRPYALGWKNSGVYSREYKHEDAEGCLVVKFVPLAGFVVLHMADEGGGTVHYLQLRSSQ